MCDQMSLRKICVLFLLFLCTASLWAVPAERTSLVVRQPDGTLLTLAMRGDEHFHYLVTADGIPVVRHGNAYYYACWEDGGMKSSGQLAHEVSLRTSEELAFIKTLAGVQDACVARSQQAKARRSAVTRQSSGVPTSGDVRVPVLLVQFADVKFSSSGSKAAFEQYIGGEGYAAEEGTGSVREYFVAQSEGQFRPQFDIIGPVTLDKEMRYYGGNDKDGNDLRARDMVSEACCKAHSTKNVVFSHYDNNKDGYVDILYVIYAGYGESSYPDVLENTVWPHQWQLETPLPLDGVKVNRYACNNELKGYSGTELAGIGTFCHEFSHCLGLPDFYDTSSEKTAFGMDVWSVMDYGCYNNGGHTPCGYTGYEKDYLGWKPLVELDNPTDVTLTAMSEGGTAYKIVNEANPEEYYVVEHRRRTAWDTYIPAEGMLILHVDYSASAWQENTLNNNPEHQRMTIIPADGVLSANTLTGDVWPGRNGGDKLTSTSNPAAKVYTGGYMEKDITNISKDGEYVRFSFMKDALAAPRLYDPEHITASGFTLVWDAVEDAAAYEVQLSLLEENPYLLDEDFSKVKEGDNDIGATLDNYTKQKGWSGYQVYGLDGAIRVGNIGSGGDLCSPIVTCDSSAVTLLFKVRKCSATDEDTHLLVGVGDKTWGNTLRGGYALVDDTKWISYWMVIDSVGFAPYLYLSSYSKGNTAFRLDVDDVYMLPGDHSAEFLGQEDNADHIASHRMATIAKLEGETCPMMSRTSVGERSADASAPSSENKRYNVTSCHTVRVDGCRYAFAELDGGLYRCQVRSVNGYIRSHYSNAVDVQISDTSLCQTEVIPHLYIHHDSLYIQAPDSVPVYYTTDGSRPTAYSTRYTAPIALGRKMVVNAIARRMGCRSSEVVSEANWFTLDGATFRVLSTVEPTVMLTEALEGNGNVGYAGHYIFTDEVQSDTMTYLLVGVDAHAFRDATALRSVVLKGDSLRSVGDSLFHGCTMLNAVVWEVDIPVKDNFFDTKSYHNLLLYLPDTARLSNPLVAAGRMAIVKEGKSGALVLSNDKPFYCPLPFVAGQVTYQRRFTQDTGVGTSAGWETIALPFDVQRFDHATKGNIAPFGRSADYHFWLAKLDSDGFRQATTLRGNTAYIIAMPHNTEYGDNSLDGTVTFSAAQATIYATEEPTVSESHRLTLIPTYAPIVPCDDIYALNVGMPYDDYQAGSVFIPDGKVISPFSAYAIPASGTEAAPFYRIQSYSDVSEPAIDVPVVESRDGVVYIWTPEAKSIVVYDMAGRQVCRVACKAGINEVASLQEGLYIIATTKVYVER